LGSQLINVGIFQEILILDSVSTLDRFQNSQSDVVFVSLGMSESLVYSHLADEKRFDVAMSRARRKLILLGNREELDQEDIFVTLFDTTLFGWCVEVGWAGLSSPLGLNNNVVVLDHSSERTV
jgi:hypothetical protein